MARRANERLERHRNGAAGSRRHMRVVGSEPIVCALTGELVLRPLSPRISVQWVILA